MRVRTSAHVSRTQPSVGDTCQLHSAHDGASAGRGTCGCMPSAAGTTSVLAIFEQCRNAHRCIFVFLGTLKIPCDTKPEMSEMLWQLSASSALQWLARSESGRKMACKTNLYRVVE